MLFNNNSINFNRRYFYWVWIISTVDIEFIDFLPMEKPNPENYKPFDAKVGGEENPALFHGMTNWQLYILALEQYIEYLERFHQIQINQKKIS